ncbi:MAG: GEVED domain-containing protein, partial [Bacteroidota bacterium]
NVSLKQLETQLRILNEDFRRLNPDTGNTPGVFQPIAADVEIEFCLASVDPDGNPTDGVTRTFTNTTTFSFDDAVKFTNQGGKDGWPRDQYLNFWVCDLIPSLLGYAQFPAVSGFPNPAATDGVVCDYAYTGDIEAAQFTGYDGRVGTHEVGHWLNLRHVWGDGPCGQDDFVDDTPTASTPSGTPFPCTFPGPDDCDDGPGDLPNMFQNYMDYGDGACQNMYTTGQKLRMLALFAPGGERESLKFSNACCPETSCPRPQASVSTDSDSAILVQWLGADSIQSVDLEYRPFGAPDWTIAGTTSDTSFVITGLDLCTTYQVRIASACNTDTNQYCEALFIETLGCCRPPANNSVDVVTDNAGDFSWTPVYGANDYEFRYRTFGDSTWNLLTAPSTSLSVIGLEECTGYEYQLRALCDTLGDTFSPVDTFFTLGCESCEMLTYCEPMGNGDTLHWIERFTLGSDLNAPTGNNLGYVNLATFSSEFFLDSTYEFSFYRGTPGNRPQTYHIWADLNRDGEFTDSTEKLFTRTPTTSDQVTNTLSFGDSIAPGRLRIRIGTEFSFTANNPLQPCEDNVKGEYEDYCIELRAPCVLPSEFQAELDSSTKDIFLTWSSTIYADSFLLEYRPVQDSSWQEVMVGDLNQSVLDSALFAECAQYVFRISSLCEDGPSASIAAPDTITTECRTGLNAALANQVRLYPNPSQGSWTIEAPVRMQRIELIDLYGRTVLQQDLRDTRWEVNTPTIANGMYLVRIQTEQGSLTRRLLINRQN